MIQISRAHFPVTVLGPGRRIGIWLQGCSIGCPNCISRDTSGEPDDSKAISVEALLNWCKSVAPDGPDGVTISGGEPFDQVAALSKLLDALNEWRGRLRKIFDILCYSGYRYDKLVAKYSGVVGKLDALIPEPYVTSRGPGKIWRGSSNQSLVPISTLGNARYSEYVGQELKRQFQVVAQSGQIWLIGIPGAEQMNAFAEECSDRGLTLESVSWTS